MKKHVPPNTFLKGFYILCSKIACFIQFVDFFWVKDPSSIRFFFLYPWLLNCFRLAFRAFTVFSNSFFKSILTVCRQNLYSTLSGSYSLLSICFTSMRNAHHTEFSTGAGISSVSLLSPISFSHKSLSQVCLVFVF